MEFLEINQSTCTKCGACAAECPVGLIDYQKNRFPSPVSGIEKSCIWCGHCVAVCPADSVIHKECPPELCLPLEESREIGFEQCSQLIKNRRSIRAYKDKAVSREDIARLIDTARYAPTGGNSQGVEWLVFNDKEQIRHLSELGTGWMRMVSQSGPAAAARMANILKLQEEGRDAFLRGAPALVVAFSQKDNPGGATNCAIALGYFDLAAGSLGLGCCWAGFFMFAAAAFPPMVEAIALPEGHRLYGALTVGYPEYRYHRIPERKRAGIIWRP